ncbi:hypothetical protein FRX31_018104 [Thalictrum thalictroides]|uniref:Reverse transcriptase zinc-binding domain-containing protein n=1 Tax=Thalictrum thalictroides TaxID=46969 RepID=A0A7J6W695_THATH|nr:hypothetical protein FRX31_018104 [Thalictrum thalictroides]
MKNANPFNVLSVVEDDNNEDNEDKEENNASEKDKAQSGSNLECSNSFGALQQTMENEEKDDASDSAEKEEGRIHTESTEEGLFWEEEPQHFVKTTITDNMEGSSPAQVTPLAIEGPPFQSPIAGLQSLDSLQNPAILPANGEALGTSADPFFLTNGEGGNTDSEEEGEDNTEEVYAHNSDSEITKKSKKVTFSNEDKRRWPHNSNGEFSIKSYIKLTHGANNSNPILKRIWMTWIPTKLSFFGWKLFFEAVPVDMAVIGCQIPIVSKCLCCQRPSQETSTHLFVHSDLAKVIWRFFSNFFGVRTYSHHNFKMVLASWFQKGRKGSLEYMCFTVTPLLIIWEIWKERNARKYEERHRWQSSAIIIKIREGNSAADYLSKMGLQYCCDGAINQRQDKRFYHLLVADKNNIPNIRHADTSR